MVGEFVQEAIRPGIAVAHRVATVSCALRLTACSPRRSCLGRRAGAVYHTCRRRHALSRAPSTAVLRIRDLDRRLFMSAAVALDALDLAALLCSRVCHDLISPTGAIVNGLEVLEEKQSDEETKTFALDLIKKSARTASARLQFCRLAFGAAGSSTAQIDLGDAQNMARGLHRGRQDQAHLEPAAGAAAEEPRQAPAQHADHRRADDPARRHHDGRSGRGRARRWVSASPAPASMRAFRRRSRALLAGTSESGGDRRARHPAVLYRPPGPRLRAHASSLPPRARRSW